MFEEYAGQRVLSLFFRHPFMQFHLRGVAKECLVSPPTARTQLVKFVKAGLVERSMRANLVLFKANAGSVRFRLLKVADFLEWFEKSGLLDFLQSKLHPLSIVLFGSVARGEDSAESDIDLLVISKNKRELDLIKFERKLKKEINCFMYTPIDWSKKAVADKSFYQRILIEGIPLHGELPVV